MGFRAVGELRRLSFDRIQEAAGCTRFCFLDGAERALCPMLRVTHNGVSFSRSTDVDMYILAVGDLPAMELSLRQWCEAHHHGNFTDPLEVVVGKEVVVLHNAEVSTS